MAFDNFKNLQENAYNYLVSQYKNLKINKNTTFNENIPSVENDLFGTFANVYDFLQIMLASVPNQILITSCSPEFLRIWATQQGIDFKQEQASEGLVNLISENTTIIVPVGFIINKDGFSYSFKTAVQCVKNTFPVIRVEQNYLILDNKIDLSVGMKITIENTNNATNLPNGTYTISEILFNTTNNETNIRLQEIIVQSATADLYFNGIYNYKIISDIKGNDSNILGNTLLNIEDTSIGITFAYSSSEGIINGQNKETVENYRSRANLAFSTLKDLSFNTKFIRNLLSGSFNIDIARLYINDTDVQNIKIGVLLDANYPFLNNTIKDDITQLLITEKPVQLPSSYLEVIGLPDVRIAIDITFNSILPNTPTMISAIIGSFKALNRSLKFEGALTDTIINNFVAGVIDIEGGGGVFLQDYEIDSFTDINGIPNRLLQVNNISINGTLYNIGYD